MGHIIFTARIRSLPEGEPSPRSRGYPSPRSGGGGRAGGGRAGDTLISGPGGGRGGGWYHNIYRFTPPPRKFLENIFSRNFFFLFGKTTFFLEPGGGPQRWTSEVDPRGWGMGGMHLVVTQEDFLV